MVLRLKTWESRSPPNLIRNATLSPKRSQSKPAPQMPHKTPGTPNRRIRPVPKSPKRDTPGTPVAGWSSPVARQAHNLKVTGSNPVPATKISNQNNRLAATLGWPFALLFWLWKHCGSIRREVGGCGAGASGKQDRCCLAFHAARIEVDMRSCRGPT
jgi:hypothetical protein